MAANSKRRKVITADDLAIPVPSWVPTSAQRDFASIVQAPDLFFDFDFDVSTIATPKLLGVQSSFELNVNDNTDMPSMQLDSSSAVSKFTAATTKACGHCALTWCAQCIEGSRKNPPVSCHVPEHGRSVCSTCASGHNVVSVPTSHALFVPHSLETAFENSFRHAFAPGSVVATSMQHIEIPAPFSFFYTHLNGTARCFEIFDAVDESLWKRPLAFSRLYVFGTDEAANCMRSLFAQFMFPLRSDPDCAATDSLSFRLCAQCCTYQAQYPSARSESDNTLTTIGRLMPNFYSASLCRKNNSSHLKKQRLPRNVVTGQTLKPAEIEVPPIIPCKVEFLKELKRTAESTVSVLLNFGSLSRPSETVGRTFTFRSVMAFKLFELHRYPEFRTYLCEVPLDRKADPLRAISLDLMTLATLFSENLDASFFKGSFNMRQTIAALAQPLRSLPRSGETGFFSSKFLADGNIASNYSQIVPDTDISSTQISMRRRVNVIELNLKYMESMIGSIFKPVSFLAPSMYISYRVVKLWSKTMHSNCAFMANAPPHILKFPTFSSCSYADIELEATSCLDELRALKDLEMTNSDGSTTDLHRTIVHAEIGIIWLLAVTASRVREIRRRLSIFQRSIESQQIGWALSEMERQLMVPLPPLEIVDVEAMYHQGISHALTHAGGAFDLKRNADLSAHMAHLPRDTVLAAVLPLFLSQAFDEISSSLTCEMSDPAYAFSRRQLDAKGDVDFVPDDYISPQFTVEDAESMTSWNIVFDHDVETSPCLFVTSCFDLIAALHFTPPALDANSAQYDLPSQAAIRQAALTARLNERRGQTLASMPRVQIDVSLPPEVEHSPGVAVPRSQRNLRGVRLMQLVLGLSQKLEDPFATAFCVLHLAQMLIYWCPHYDLAMQMLNKLKLQCDELLLHMPEEIYPAYARSFILACQCQASLILEQYSNHIAAGLTSPFFIGSLVHLNLKDFGMVEGIVCSVDVASPFVLMCEHPQLGIIWTMLFDEKELGTICNRPLTWKNIDQDVPFDGPLFGTLYGHSHRSLVQEIRLGRYSFARMLHDVRARHPVKM